MSMPLEWIRPAAAPLLGRDEVHVWRLDLDRRSQANAKMVRLAVSGTPPSSTSGEQPVRYDTANNVFGTGPWDNVFYVFDSAAKKWSRQTVIGNVGSVATLSSPVPLALSSREALTCLRIQ